MNRRPTLLLGSLALVALLGLAQPSATHATATNVEGHVTQVTLYRGQAHVTRTLAVPDGTGSMEIVVGHLPEQVVANSLYAEGGDAVEIRAVRYRTHAVSQEPREEVRKLDEQILDVTQQIDLKNKRIDLLGQRSGYLNRLEGFVAPTANFDLAKGVLDAAALEKISQFVFAQHEKIAEEQVELAKQGHDLSEQLALLQRKRAEIASDASLTEREAVLFVEKHAPGPAEVWLYYLVDNCGWSPNYTMRADKDRKEVRVEYNALSINSQAKTGTT